jgi:hypothetical protein
MRLFDLGDYDLGDLGDNDLVCGRLIWEIMILDVAI